MAEQTYLRDVLDMPESVHAGDFKVELTGGFTETELRVEQYVVTEQLRAAFGEAMSIVRAAVRDGSSHAAYLHGSFGSGKSHFLTVLHAILNNSPAARAKPAVQPIVAEHDEWLAGKQFLMVPYHLVGASDVDSAILGGYVATVRALHPEAPTPAVYRADAMLVDAKRQRRFLDDDTKFVEWLGTRNPVTAHGAGEVDDLDVIDGGDVAAWSGTDLDHAFAAPAGDPVREALVSALLSGPMSSYVRGATGDAAAFLPLETGLSVVTRHARELGYDGLILFLDELILWLQAHMSDQQFVNTQVSKLVKLIESGEVDRALPIVSFISRQRDLTKLVGEDVTGADVKNLEAQVEYLAGRFDVVNLEDRNLPAIIKERVLKPKPGKQAEIDRAFGGIESSKQLERDVLLDAGGATGASWEDFKAVYPLSPALLNVLVALSGALQRERTGLKLLQEMLHRRRDDMKLGELIPLGDLWDVLETGTGEAFSDQLRQESESAARFYHNARNFLLQKYGGEETPQFRGEDRVVKTLILAALAPNVPALARLTGDRLAALNHGSIRSRVASAGSVVVKNLRELETEHGEIRHEGEQNPVFRLVLSDLDTKPYLDAVGEQDSIGARRVWVKRKLWELLGIGDAEEFVAKKEIVWHGTRRTCEFVFANVRDRQELPDVRFSPDLNGRVRFILDYPFDDADHGPRDDAARVADLGRECNEPTLVWLPHFFSTQKSAQLGQLIKIRYLLAQNRLDDFAGSLSPDNRMKLRNQLAAQAENLESQLGAALAQLYGIASYDEATVGAQVGEGGHVLSLRTGHTPRRLLGGAGFEQNLLALADDLFTSLYPKHPDFDPNGNRKAVTLGELRTVLGWITRAMEDPARRVVVDGKQLPLVKRIVHPLELGQVSDGPLNVSTDWRRHIDQCAGQHGVADDYPVDEIRRWITEDLGYAGLDKSFLNLIVATYALLADRAWVLHGSPLAEPPDLDRIGPGHALRAQELPGTDEFTTARHRAAVLFGVHVPELLSARNAARLATEVREKSAELQHAANGVRRSLGDHREALGLTARLADELTDRERTANETAELAIELGGNHDSTALVRYLASAGLAATDEVLAKALTSAPEVERTLQHAQWQVLGSAHGFTAREDQIGERARGLFAKLADVAAADELVQPLAPMLEQAGRDALALVTEAAEHAGPTTPPPEPAPEQVSLTEDGAPPVSGGTSSGSGTKRVSANEAEQVLSGILDEIGDYARRHPQARFDLTWRVVGEGDS